MSEGIARTDPQGGRTAPSSRLVQSQAIKLERVQARFLRQVVTDLSLLTRTAVKGVVHAATDSSAADLLASLPSPSCFSVVATRLRGAAVSSYGPRLRDAESGLLYLASDLGKTIVEAVLGGELSVAAPRSGELTSLEQTLLHAPMEKFAAAFKAAWCEEMPPIEVETGGIVSDSRFLKLDPHMTTLRMRLTLQIGSCEGDLCVGVPLRLVRSLEDVSTTESPEAQQMNVLSLLRGSQLQFEVQLSGPSVRVADLGSLRPGNVFTFARSVDHPLTGLLNNQPVFSGHILVQAGRRCFVLKNAT